MGYMQTVGIHVIAVKVSIPIHKFLSLSFVLKQRKSYYSLRTYWDTM
jgi:hypothetical protein